MNQVEEFEPVWAFQHEQDRRTILTEIANNVALTTLEKVIMMVRVDYAFDKAFQEHKKLITWLTAAQVYKIIKEDKTYENCFPDLPQVLKNTNDADVLDAEIRLQELDLLVEFTDRNSLPGRGHALAVNTPAVRQLTDHGFEGEPVYDPFPKKLNHTQRKVLRVIKRLKEQASICQLHDITVLTGLSATTVKYTLVDLVMLDVMSLSNYKQRLEINLKE